MRQLGTAVEGSALLLFCALSAGCAGSLMYYPDSTVYGTPAEKGLRYEEVSFTSRDGTALNGWFIPAVGKAAGTVVHFHGNAQNMTSHVAFIDWLPAEGFNVFTFDYRGYGRSAGRPERQGVFEDCVAAVEYVRSRPDVDSERLLIFGQSLGGANALAVVGEGRAKGIRAVAADSSFCSYRSILRDKMGEVPVLGLVKWPLSGIVISNRHSPGAMVGKIAPVPLLLIHGAADRVVPYYHAQVLMAKAREPKELWTVEGGGHVEAVSVYGDVYRRRLVRFFADALRGRPGGDAGE